MRVLFLAYYFPPDSSSGSFRPLFFANHLTRMGVDVHVLTAKVEDYLCEQTVDEKLLSTLSKQVRVTRCGVQRPREAVIAFRDRLMRKRSSSRNGATNQVAGATSRQGASRLQKLKDTATDLLATPDPQVGWIPDCVRRGKEIIGKEKFDLIFATGGPWSGLVAAARLKKASGLPLVLDFRDPWYSNPAAAGRAKICRRIDLALEKYVMNSADAIIANTEELRADFLKRFPQLSGDQVVAITNGFEDYLPALARPSGRPLTLTHTGALYFSRNPLPLLQAAADLITSGRIGKGDFRLQFVGGIQVDDSRVSDLLSSEALTGVVDVVARVPYAESLRYTQEADALLLIQPDFPLQVPRKLFEYMAAQKPLFCIAERPSATGNLVEENGLGYVCGNEESEIGESLSKLVADWHGGGLSSFASGRFDKFRNGCLTEKLMEIFSQVIPGIPPNVANAGVTEKVLHGRGGI
ncbi:MAG: glycosyltransferase [Desulfuromonadales bacterium]|nr:glycosyltransferase [Desulfuromonadales bacterium]